MADQLAPTVARLRAAPGRAAAGRAGQGCADGTPRAGPRCRPGGTGAARGPGRSHRAGGGVGAARPHPHLPRAATPAVAAAGTGPRGRRPPAGARRRSPLRLHLVPVHPGTTAPLPRPQGIGDVLTAAGTAEELTWLLVADSTWSPTPASTRAPRPPGDTCGRCRNRHRWRRSAWAGRCGSAASPSTAPTAPSSATAPARGSPVRGCRCGVARTSWRGRIPPPTPRRLRHRRPRPSPSASTEDCTTVAAVLTHALGPANLRDDACTLCVRICA